MKFEFFFFYNRLFFSFDKKYVAGFVLKMFASHGEQYSATRTQTKYLYESRNTNIFMHDFAYQMFLDSVI